MVTLDPLLWIGVIGALSCVSILWRANPFSMWSYTTLQVIVLVLSLVGNIKNLTVGIQGLTTGAFINLIPLCLAAFAYFKFYPKQRWVSRITIAFMTGVGFATRLVPMVKTQIVSQVLQVIPTSWNFSDPSSVLVGIVGLISYVSTLLYFTFTRTNPTKYETYFRQAGKYLLMITIGTMFSDWVTAKLGNWLTFVQFMAMDFLGLI